MFKLLLFIALISASSHGKTSRIEGERLASVGEFYYQLSLQIDSVYKCGAAIISPKWAITTANCVIMKRRHQTWINGDATFKTEDLITYPKENITLRAGSVYKEKELAKYYRIEDIIIPEQVKSNINYDICLLRIKNGIDFNKDTDKIDLPDENYKIDNITTITSGWGEYKQLVSLQLDILINNKACVDEYGPKVADMICTRYKYVCPYYLGGLLVQNNKLIGLLATDAGCSNTETTVYTNLVKLRSYIKKVTEV